MDETIALGQRGGRKKEKRAKLFATAEQIKEMRAEGKTVREVAEHFGVSTALIYQRLQAEKL